MEGNTVQLVHNCSLCLRTLYTKASLKSFHYYVFCIMPILKINVLFCLWKYCSWSVSQFERKLNSIDKDWFFIHLTCHANKWFFVHSVSVLISVKTAPSTDSALKALLTLNPSTCICCRDIQMRHDNTHDLHGSVNSWICHTSKSHKLNFSPITIWTT